MRLLSFARPTRLFRHWRAVVACACSIHAFGCGDNSPTTPTPPATLSGLWPLQIAASRSCIGVIPSGYGSAVAGVELTQSGTVLSGTVTRDGQTVGQITGTVVGRVLTLSLAFSGSVPGRFPGIDPACSFTGTTPAGTTGITDGSCFMSIKLAGTLACPFSCDAPDHIVNFQRSRRCPPS